MTIEERLKLYVAFAKDQVMGTKPEDLNWLDERPDAGVCLHCDYGGGQGMVEHDPRCLFKLVVEDLDKYEKDEK